MLLIYYLAEGRTQFQGLLCGLSKHNGSSTLSQGINMWALLADKYIHSDYSLRIWEMTGGLSLRVLPASIHPHSNKETTVIFGLLVSVSTQTLI